jgi:tetratricopeptide (TPR) repeat protein
MQFGRVLFRRRRRPVDRFALERLLSEALPEGAAALPFERSLPLPRATSEIFGHLLFAISFLAFGSLRFGLGPNPVAISLVTLGLALVLAGAILRGGLNPYRRLYVSDAGVRIHRAFGSLDLPWWKVQSIASSGDISTVVLRTDDQRARLDLARLDETARRGVVNALRARLRPGMVIEPLHESRLNRATAANTLAVVGSVVLVSAVFFEARGGALGVRCSGPSAYLSARFEVPRQPGCVFIRVSGAAKRAGIRRGDQMIALDGTPVTSGPQFSGLFDAHEGNTFVFRVVRAHSHEADDVKVSFGPGTGIDAPPDDPITPFLEAKDDLGRHLEIGVGEYSKAIELAPDFDLAYAGRAQVEQHYNKHPEAIADYRKAIELDPNLAEALRSLAWLLAASSDVPPHESVELIERAVSSDGCDEQIKDNNSDCGQDYAVYADILLRLRDPRHAIERAILALRFDAGELAPHATLAWAYTQLGDLDGARSELALYRASTGSDGETVRQLETTVASGIQATPTP